MKPIDSQTAVLPNVGAIVEAEVKDVRSNHRGKINQDIKVAASFDDLMVSLKFLISGESDIGPIKLSRDIRFRYR